jgi:hypothetical protein
VLDEGVRQQAHIGGGEVQALGAGGRHDVGGVAGEKEPAEAHGLRHEAAQRRDAFLHRGAGDERCGTLRVEAPAQLVPETRVAPAGRLLLDRDLHVVAAEVARAHGAERKAALMMRVDELVGDGRGLRQHAEPAEGIDALEGGERLGGDAAAADAAEAVAARDEIAGEHAALAHPLEDDSRTRSGEILDRQRFRLEERRHSGGVERVHQVARDLGLAVDGDRPADEAGEVDAVAGAGEGERDAVMDQALAVHAAPGVGPVDERDGARFQHAGADAAEHMRPAAALQHDVVDAGEMQEAREDEPGRAGAEDGYLGAHLKLSGRAGHAGAGHAGIVASLGPAWKMVGRGTGSWAQPWRGRSEWLSAPSSSTRTL